jgi:hypothetical protein
MVGIPRGRKSAHACCAVPRAWARNVSISSTLSHRSYRVAKKKKTLGHRHLWTRMSPHANGNGVLNHHKSLDQDVRQEATILLLLDIKRETFVWRMVN